MFLAQRRTLTFAGARYFSSGRAANFDPATRILKAESDASIPKDANFVEAVWRNHKQWENRTAMTCGISGRQWSYGAAFGALDRLSGALPAELGLKSGDVIATFLPNVPEFVITFFGAAAGGIIVSPLNPLYTPDELAKLLVSSKAKAVVTIPQLLDTVRAALDKLPGGGCPVILANGQGEKDTLSFEKLVEKKTDKRLERPPPEAVLALPFSSGTTGPPKGVVINHANLVANLYSTNHPAVVPKVENDSGENCTIAMLPFFHIYGISCFLGLTLSRGNNLVTLPKFEPQAFVNAMNKYKPTYLFLVPPLMSFVARSPLVTSEMLSCVNFIGTGAAPITVQILKEVVEKTKGANTMVKNGYGLTETSGVTTITASNVDTSEVSASIGKICPNMEVMVVDGAEAALPLGQVGELWVRGPQVMLGYLDNPKATQNTITPDGWLKTGDIATISEKGDIYIVDRLKEIIKVKGFQVSPSELEDVLIQMEAIADVAVTAAPHDDLDEAPRAFVVLKSGATLTAEDVHKFVEPRVAKFKRLVGGVHFVQQIPKSAAGKILRKDLNDLLK